MAKKRIVMALGHRALGTNLPEQKEAVAKTARVIADFIQEGWQVALVHSNAPQVGMIHTAMNEFGKQHEGYTSAPMSVCSAMSQGYIGYDLQNGIRTELIKRGIYKPVATILTQMMVDPYDEGTHLHLMQAMIATGAQQTAIQHYRYVTQLFMEQLGASPSAELTALYRELVRSTQSVEMDLRVVRETLCEVRPNPGPYYCEYAIFQDVYRLSARTAARTGQVVQLAMLSVLDARGKPLTTRQIGVSMSRVRQVIHSGLRQGDAYTRFSATQYLLLLPCASYENGGKVLDRLVTSFRRIYPKMRVLLQYSVLPLMPLM